MDLPSSSSSMSMSMSMSMSKILIRTILTLGFVVHVVASSNSNTTPLLFVDSFNSRPFTCGTSATSSSSNNNNNSNCIRHSNVDVELNMASRFGLRKMIKSAITSPFSFTDTKSTCTSSTAAIQTQTQTENDINVNIPRISVRPRPLVSLDESTGMYIPPPQPEKSLQQTQQLKKTTLISDSPSSLTYKHTSSSQPSSVYYEYESSSPSSSSSSNGFDELSESGWGAFKDVFYDTVDSFSIIPKIIGLITSNDNVNNDYMSSTLTPNSIRNRNLAVAYSDTVEFKSANSLSGGVGSSVGAGGGGGPFKSILADDRKKKSNNNTNNKKPITSSSSTGADNTQLVRKYESSLLASNKDRSDGKDLYRSDTRRSFDSAKDGIYDLFTLGKKTKEVPTSTGVKSGNEITTPTTTTTTTTDKTAKKSPLQNLSSPLGKVSSSTSSRTPPTMTINTLESSSATDTTSFKPMAKPSTNKDETVANLTPYLADLDSPNPIKVLKAKFAIATDERKRQRKIKEEKRRIAVDNAKRSVFNVVDNIKGAYDTVIGLPQQVEEAILSAEEAIEQTAAQTRKTAKEVKAIPSKVQKAVQDTKQSVKNTQRAAVEVVEEVRSVPRRVEQRVVDTKRSIQETKEGVENFVNKVDEITFQAKVMAGLEKPKPIPPPPPPPPRTNKEIALDVAGVVAKTTGQAAVVVGKGTVGMTTSAVKVALNAAAAAREKEDKKRLEEQRKREVEGGGDMKGGDKNKKASLMSKFAHMINMQKKKKETIPKTSNAEKNTVPSVDLGLVSPVLDVTIGTIDPLLELEVADALKSAEEALDIAEMETSNPSSKLSSEEINDALAKAKSAASQARKDANDLQTMLMKKKEHFFKP